MNAFLSIGLAKRFGAAAVIVGTLLLSGCGSKSDIIGYDVQLEMWGLFDDSKAYLTIFNAYRTANPFVKKIDYRKFTPESYKEDLLSAMAAGKAPDVFLIQNSWLPEFKDKIAPMPAELFSEVQLRNTMVDVVADDFLDEGKLYALPLSVDSLGLYYNKDMLNSLGFTAPPASWEDFVSTTNKITQLNQFGDIERSGAALGTAYNVNRSTDILSMLMFQNGTTMVNEKLGRAQFDVSALDADRKLSSPGEDALRFYTQFSQLKSDSYSWNKQMPYSVDAFSEGRVAMMINYSWQYDTIRKKNPKLNFAVAPAPQLSSEQKANAANYWAYAVAKDLSGGEKVSKETFEAWQFIKFLTMKHNGSFARVNALSGSVTNTNITIDPALDYLKNVPKPAARRDIIELQKNDPVLGPFAEGNLVAKSWSRPEADKVETIFLEMIDAVNTGKESTGQALKAAASRVTRLMK